MPGVEIPESAVAKDSFMDKFNNSEFQHSVNAFSSSYDDDSQVSDDSSSSSDESSHSKSTANAANEVKEMARHETNAIRRWRLITLTVILLTGALVATGSFLYLKNQEDKDATDSYKLFTHSIAGASDRQFGEMQISFHDMAESITAASVTNGEEFPFVRVKLFEVSASQTRQLTGIEMFSWNPLVTAPQRALWKSFVERERDWYDESKAFLINDDTNLLTHSSYAPNATIRDFIWASNEETGAAAVEASAPLLAPIWQMSPPPFSPEFINYDMMQEGYAQTMLPVVQRTRDGLMSALDPTLGRLAGIAVSPEDHEDFHRQYVDSVKEGLTSYDHPHSVHVQPVFKELQNPGSALVGFLAFVVPWDKYLSNLLPETVEGIYAVLRNTCGQAHTYVVRGIRADYMGEGDYHDRDFHHTEVIVPLTKYGYNETKDVEGHCVYSLYLYSSTEYESASETDLPYIFTVAVGVIFGAMALTFLIYDRFVRRRNNKVIDAATKSNEIINTLFPQQVRDRLFADKRQDAGNVNDKSDLKNMMNSGDFAISGNDHEDDEDEVDEGIMYKTKPIADLFPETTILFADIAGFTAWSSVREPSQVFILLETLYRAFDEIAKKRRVFKVETVGDCYVAVTGLPDPRKDHAVAMARFARDCLVKMRSLSKKLEVTLGPDTGDLAMRIGMHSGPVTAGVLRGERSRFQLFGDTMNTAARMEHTGVRDKIQMSQETADLLIAAGKTNWLSQREDVVHAKGKGEMQTYWLEIATRNNSSINDCSSVSGSSQIDVNDDHLAPASLVFDSKTTRLIEWNVDVLSRLLKQIVARRNVCEKEAQSRRPNESFFMQQEKSGKMTMDEVAEIITLPEFHETEGMHAEDGVELPSVVVQQLHDYVCNIASIYRDNPFHNFEHAAHVTMSVVKLLSRIVAPQDVVLDEKGRGRRNIASTLHDHTYGITSDPLIQFSCVLSALIHDADHSGVPNATLVKEETDIARQYQNKSVAEQNSVDLCWNLLMDSDYKELRQTIYETDGELKRFRQLVVNSVMATDIVDKELKNLRNARWEKAFSEEEDLGKRDSVNRKATIVIEHLIQASDVAHTMQHWHIYRKWNERFFYECYQAYKDGRADTDPSVNWYKGEIGFFDFYIIPLAKKLKDCGVFGVSSDEYLNYAMKNRVEWEARGQEVVAEMMEKVNASSNEK